MQPTPVSPEPESTPKPPAVASAEGESPGRTTAVDDATEASSVKPAAPEPKKSQAVGKNDAPTLAELRKNPEQFADQEVTLAQLYTLGPKATFRANGTVGVPAVESVMTVSGTGFVGPQPGGSAATLEADPSLIETMIEKDLLRRDEPAGQAVPKRAGPVAKKAQGPAAKKAAAPVDPGPTVSVAILTVRVAKTPARYAANGPEVQLVRPSSCSI